jgi:uncharacterized membrane protein
LLTVADRVTARPQPGAGKAGQTMDTQSTHRMSTDGPEPSERHSARATVLLWCHRLLRLVVTALVGLGVYHLVLEEFDTHGRLVWGFLLIWVLCAYVLLPQLNRVLARVYVPDYFIGRARTADGLLGDPVNLAVLGTADQLAAALRTAGWTAADPLNPSTGWGITRASLLRRSYPAAPVSPLFVFGRRQDLVFEREVAGSPAQRHHVRFWACPPGWKLPGGFGADLVGAATFDRRVGLSLFTLQVTHKVAERTDEERDLVVAALRSAGAAVHVVRHFTTGYHTRNGGGDAIETDGDLPIVDLRAVAAPEGTSREAPPTGEAQGAAGSTNAESPAGLARAGARVDPARGWSPVERHRSLFGSGTSLDRLVFFSDAVFAIAMTLLVLELILPGDLDPREVDRALAAHLPEFLAYVLSFTVIGTAWMNHHRKFTVIRRYDVRLQWLNLSLLFLIALLPMPTSLLSDYGGRTSPWPVVLYAVVTAGVYITLSLIWRHAWRAGLIAPEVDAELYRYVLHGAWPVPAVFLGSVPVAFVSPELAAYSWLLLVPVLPTARWLRRRNAGLAERESE